MLALALGIAGALTLGPARPSARAQTASGAATSGGPPSATAPALVPADKTVVRRFALITGASQGGLDRVPLRFAASDARAIGHVLEDLGGLGEPETILLLDIGREQLRAGFDRVRRMVAAARAPGSRTEMIFYYSGHSDETGLLLGPERVSYPEIRAWVDQTGADVRIAVLDSCASGALTRGKGGVRRPPFLVDTSSAARGHAYLTASAENEAAQESDRLGAAYFTHYLVSGLRGAADVSHDGRVTLSEAYQYAFTETLARTEASRGGPQHASYDFQLAGKGDLVMTDLRATSASLVLPSEMSGRLFVRDAQGLLVAEVHKLPAQPIELGLPPGRYRVTLDDDRRLSEATIQLDAGKRSTLSDRQMVAMVASPATARGPGAPASASASAAEVSPAVDLAHALVAPAPAQPPRYALNVSLFPGIDSNGGVPSDNKLVLGFGARSANLDGLALTLGHYASGNVRGAELAAIVNLAGGDLHGTQMSGGVNMALGSVSGTQLAGTANWAQGSAHGFQGAGIANGAAGGRGLQAAGVVNLLRADYTGAQLAGISNIAQGQLRGVQVAGVANIAEGVRGVQLAVVNVGGDVDGAQIGVVNVARRVRGTQIGVVDVATESEEGASFGLVTVARDGIHEIELSTTEAGATVLAGVLGSKHVFTRLGVGILAAPGDIPGGRGVASGSTADRRHYLLQWGMGGRFTFGDRWFVDGEAIGWELMHAGGVASGGGSTGSNSFDAEDAVLGSARVLLGYRVTSLLSVVVGPTYNVLVGWNGTDLVTSPALAESVMHDGRTTVRMYPGLVLGVRL